MEPSLFKDDEFCRIIKLRLQERSTNKIATPFRKLQCGSKVRHSHISKQDRRAAVAVLLRFDQDGAIEMLFIKRTENPKDPWSGDIALPGGRQDEGETDLETAIRECKEEVGIDLTGGGYAYLGQLDDRIAKKTKTSRVILSSFVFIDERPNKERERRGVDNLMIQEHEVAAAWWVKVSDIATIPQTNKLVPATRFLKAFRLQYFPEGILRAMGLDVIGISGIKLPTPPGLPEDTDTVLWGLTLGLIKDLMKVVQFDDLNSSLFVGKEFFNATDISFPHTWWGLDVSLQYAYRFTQRKTKNNDNKNKTTASTIRSLLPISASAMIIALTVVTFWKRP